MLLVGDRHAFTKRGTHRKEQNLLVKRCPRASAKQTFSSRVAFRFGPARLRRRNLPKYEASIPVLVVLGSRAVLLGSTGSASSSCGTQKVISMGKRTVKASNLYLRALESNRDTYAPPPRGDMPLLETKHGNSGSHPNTPPRRFGPCGGWGWVLGGGGAGAEGQGLKKF